ncbi:signal peptide peptidase SppA [Ochrovirga pacifica]|uniref:signal peptide peptidase SppA n=1 Tax=Ochrovirga pacifica TaxID=1042376 RepID=UPI0002558E78|nr:signal peptide peptidase SppA [Ochrovirga pacifica]
MNFLKNVLASLVAICLALVIFVTIGVAIAMVASKDAIKEVKPNSVLEIDLSGELNDYAPTALNPVAEALGLENQTYGFNQISKAIESAIYDDKIKGISLTNIPENIGWAQLTALRAMLEDFKKSGKFIYAYEDVYSQKKYYLYTVADQLFISPLGYVELKGLHSEVMFFKDFQEKYGVKMEVVRHGKYKSAVEPFLANEMSDANREQITALITGLWQQVANEINSSRNFDVNAAVMNLYGQSATSAKEHGLVDAILYPDAYEKLMQQKLGTEALEKVKMNDYLAQVTLLEMLPKTQKIAVIYAQGEIIYGKGDLKTIGQEKMIKAFKKATEDNNVKAIVLRINSPGGSALASDLIWNAVQMAKEKKPVVVSMGNLAASGGYYIACGANKIFAEPTTITGSIGVFGVLPNAAKLTQDIGIHTEVVSTHDNGIHYSPFHPVDKRFKGVVKNSIEHIYDTFVTRVSEGRKMTKQQVNQIAQGRVWTGSKALEIGLVDELGSLEDAIIYASEQVALQDFSIEEYPKYDLDLKEMLGFSPLLQTKFGWNAFLPKKVSSKATILQRVLEEPSAQTRIPFELMVE